MRAASDAIVAGVAAGLPGWVEAQVARILDAWGQADPETHAAALRAAAAAGGAAADRVTRDLRAMLALDPAEQASTPLEIVRSAFAEPTTVLVAVGVPAVERDAFDERAWPGDRYALVPRTLGDVGTGLDPSDLGAQQLAWGLAKAAVLRARAARR
jgi:hypothetical protein